MLLNYFIHLFFSKASKSSAYHNVSRGSYPIFAPKGGRRFFPVPEVVLPVPLGCAAIFVFSPSVVFAVLGVFVGLGSCSD